MRAASAGLLVMSVAVWACQTPTSDPPIPGPVKSAEFGIFYGGQVQERERIPFVLDQGRQSQGFRIEFDAPLQRATRVAWELDMPGTAKGVRDERGRRGRGRLIKHDEVVVPAGHQRFDRVLPFEPRDSLGMWNIQVRVEEQIVIDRPFEVHAP